MAAAIIASGLAAGTFAAIWRALKRIEDQEVATFRAQVGIINAQFQRDLEALFLRFQRSEL